MDDVRIHCYQLSVSLLSATGLGPHKSTVLKHMLMAVYIFIFSSVLIFQFINLISIEHNMNQLVRNLSVIIMSIGCASKYCTFLLQKENIGEIVRRIKDDWDSITNEMEFQIIRQYALRGRYYSKIFAMMMCQTGFLLVFSQYAPVLLDYVIPLNESRESFLLGSYEASAFYSNHPHIFRLYMMSTIIVLNLTFVGTETSSIMWIQHAASLFGIATYYTKITFDGKFAKIPDRNYTVEDMLIIAVTKYNHGIESVLEYLSAHAYVSILYIFPTFVKHVSKTFLIAYLVLLLCGMTSLSINLYQLAIAFPDKITELITSGSFVMSQLAYMYYMNLMIQQLTDVCNNIFYEAYNTKWYEISLSMQKNLLFFCQRTSKNLVIGVSGIYVASIEGFSAICKLSLSYFMTMYSIQQ